MREYLQRGGFWFLDDFWGSVEWESLDAQMKKIFPEFESRTFPPAIRCFMLFSISIG